jgi:uncharacterized protein (TIGR03067 family)
MWRSLTLAGLVAALLSVSAPAQEDKKDKAEKKDEEAKKLEGAWTATHWQRGTGIIGKDDVKTELVLGKGTYEFPKGINRVGTKGTYKTVAGKNHIDLTPGDGPAKGKTLQGIYKVEGDTLTLCFRPAGMERPTKFESTDRNTVLAKYEKKKKEEK